MRAAMHAVPRECAGSPLRPTAEGGLELDVIFEPHTFTRWRLLQQLGYGDPNMVAGDRITLPRVCLVAQHQTSGLSSRA